MSISPRRSVEYVASAWLAPFRAYTRPYFFSSHYQEGSAQPLALSLKNYSGLQTLLVFYNAISWLLSLKSLSMVS